mmetsp:Transcript_7602/g.13772  ORF Transcript_7602/g.13772 Transcript_7602/m.13772 type:complete len:213 (-) Transcript_7602:15-653(-)
MFNSPCPTDTLKWVWIVPKYPWGIFLSSSPIFGKAPNRHGYDNTAEVTLQVSTVYPCHTEEEARHTSSISAFAVRRNQRSHAYPLILHQFISSCPGHPRFRGKISRPALCSPHRSTGAPPPSRDDGGRPCHPHNAERQSYSQQEYSFGLGGLPCFHHAAPTEVEHAGEGALDCPALEGPSSGGGGHGSPAATFDFRGRGISLLSSKRGLILH